MQNNPQAGLTFSLAVVKSGLPRPHLPPNLSPTVHLMSSYRTVAIVGVGLIGGSIGQALKRRSLAERVIGVGRRQTSLDKAIEVGAIDRSSTSIEEAVSEADLVVIASPVGLIPEHALLALHSAPAEAVITDAGSTKKAIVDQIEAGAAPNVGRFVGSHPLAGDHRTGPEHARASLLEGKNVILTPTPSTDSQAIAKVESFWQNLGANVLQMSAEEHDNALAATSHLPHLVASALAKATPENWLELAASGWCDTTRVAAADPELWMQIFSQNRDAVLAAVERMTAELDCLKSNLDSQDWPQLKEYLKNAKRIRDALGN